MQKSVLEYLEAAAESCPDKIAFADDIDTLSYKELLHTAHVIAGFFLKNPDFPFGKPIVVFCGRNIRSLAAFLGAAYTGNFYVPIDGQLPAERINAMLEILQPAAILITDTKQSPAAAAFSRLPASYGDRTFFYEDILFAPASAMEKLQAAWELEKRRRSALDTDPLYAIFTSGSTGTPKAVLVSHRSVIDLADQFTRAFHFNSDSVFGNQAPFDFDISVKDIYLTLKNHGTLHVIPKILFVSPAKLIQYLNNRRVNTLIWAVSAMRILENFKSFAHDHPRYVKKVLFSGEVMPCKVLNYWRSYMPDTIFVNVYGPTEITCNCTYYIVDRDYPDDGVLPVGKPFENTGIVILNASQKQAAVGEIGEICVKGTCLALGYYGAPEKTAAVFCQNPLQTLYPERIYRTGDLGKMDADGNLYYISRTDYQIKHMGHRIELGELETHANAFPDVQAACCIYDRAKNKILMFYQAQKPCDRELLTALGKKLPKYMCPNKLIWKETLPLNKNGKIDRVRLQKEELAHV